MNIRRDDFVQVIAGVWREQRGKVIRTNPEKRQVVVEGTNLVWKHLRRSQQNPQGGRIQMERPLNVSKIQLICQACGEPTRVGTGLVEVELSEGRKKVRRFRMCKKCKEPVSEQDKSIRDKGEMVTA